ncbi:acyltransferase [Aliarcobacter butzleri]|uniref:acyltransferase n=1 Tax=Aliarcobacter butzleri TaxID=28197 RepID=UPI0021B4B11A|nr:acyltransferase [Aliarcobacter butzleri]MCT7597602.1 acyltransferase [Aliarcobacter butzleri]
MINLIFKILVKPFVIALRFTSFYHMSVFCSKIPFSLGNKLRFYFYKNVLRNIGDNVHFPYGVIFTHKEISIGNNVRFGPYNTIGLVDFGNDILIGQYVHFLSGKNQHSYKRKDIPINQQNGKQERIFIENDIWIGTGSIIMSNISRGTVVAAGSVVAKSFDEYSVIAGNPARVIKRR